MESKVNDVKRLREDMVAPFVAGDEDLALAGKVSKEAIDFLTVKIRAIESAVENRIKLKEPYEYLLTIPGIGKILSLTIMLETGAMDRFEKVGNYASYCRKVSTVSFRQACVAEKSLPRVRLRGKRSPGVPVVGPQAVVDLRFWVEHANQESLTGKPVW